MLQAIDWHDAIGPFNCAVEAPGLPPSDVRGLAWTTARPSRRHSLSPKRKGRAGFDQRAPFNLLAKR